MQRLAGSITLGVGLIALLASPAAAAEALPGGYYLAPIGAVLALIFAFIF